MGVWATAVYMVGHACSLGKLVPVMGHMDTVLLLRKELLVLAWVAWACCPDCAVDEPVCLSSISPAADRDKSLDLI